MSDPLASPLLPQAPTGPPLKVRAPRQPRQLDANPADFYDQPATTPASPDDAAANFYDNDANGQLTTSVDLAHTGKPDDHARAMALADKTGFPIDFIGRNLDEVQREADRRDFNAAQFRAKSPALADWLQNPDHALVSGDDHSVLQKLELHIQSIAQAWRQGTVQGDLGDEAVALRAQAARAAGGAAVPLNPEQAAHLAVIDQAEGFFADETKNQGALAYGVRTTASLARGLIGFAKAGAQPGMLGGALGGAAALASGNPEAVIPAIKTGVAVGGTAGTLKYAFDQSMGSAFQEFSKMTDASGQPLDPKVASIASAGVGAINAALNIMGERVLLKLVPGASQFLNANQLGPQAAMQEAVKVALTKPTFRAVLLEAGKNWAHSAGINGALGVAQELTTILGRDAAEAASGQEFAPQPEGADVERVKEAGISGLVGGLGVGAILSAPNVVFGTRAVRNADAVVEQFKALGETVKESKTAERLPSAVQDLTQHAVDTHQAPENVFVDVAAFQTLFQSQPGAAEEAATQILGSPDQYREAVATGGDLVIPLADYTARVAGTPLGDQMLQDIRIRQGDLSQREAKAQADAMETAAGPIPDEPVLTAAQKSEQRFQTGIAAQLQDAGASATEAEAQSALPTAFFRTLGQRVGQNLFDKYRVNVARREAPPEAAKIEVPEQDEGKRRKPVAKQSAAEAYDHLFATRERLQDMTPPSSWARFDDDVGETRSGDTGILASIAKQGQATFDKLFERLKSLGQTDEQIWAKLDDIQAERDERAGMEKGPTAPAKGQGLRDDTPFAPNVSMLFQRKAGAPGDEAAIQEGLFGDKTLIGNEQTDLLGADEGKPTLKLKDSKIGADEVSRVKRDGAEPEGERPGELFQDERGSISFGGTNPIREFNISLLPTADRSTFLHEAGHLFLEVLSDVAGGNEQTAGDLNTIREWLGNTGEPFTVEQHEQFARGIEAYLLDGKAPSAPLRTAFARFRTWLTALYRSITQLGVPLTPEVRGVMDRLVATDDEISRAQQGQQYVPLKQADLGATAAEFAAYTRSTQRATESAQTGLLADLLKEQRRESTAFWQAETERTRAAVAATLEADPAYQALGYLQTGSLLEGAPEELKLAMLEDNPVKLNRDILVHRYGDAILADLPGGTRGEGRRVWQADGGVDPDELAPHFGFESGDELVQALTEKKGKPLNGPLGEIERQTRAQMEANHPDMLNDSARLAQAAQNEVHNGEQTNVLLTELKMLGKRRGQRLPPNIDAIRAQSERLVGSKTIRDLAPFSYQNAEAKNAKLTEEALAKGDFPAAQEYKRKQLLNHLAYKVATRLQEQSAKAADYLDQMGADRVTAVLTKAGGTYTEQRDKLLERFDFKPRSLKAIDRNTSLADWIKEQEALGREPNISADLQAEAFRTNWKNLTPGQLFDLRDAVKQIVHLARTKNDLLAEQKGREIQASLDEMTTGIRDATKTPRKAPLGSLTASERLTANIEGFVAYSTKLGVLVRNLDGNKDDGPVFRNFLVPIEESQNHEAKRLVIEGAKTDAIFDRFYDRADNVRMAKFERQVVRGAEEAGMLSHWDRIMVLLNSGTEDNRAKLTDGSTLRLTESGVQAIINSLDKRDTEYAQAVWDQIGSYWEEIKAKQERVTGLAPEKVEPHVVRTRWGDLKGGYFPIVYDSEQSPIAFGHDMADEANMMKRTGYGSSTTARGHTINRVASSGLPLRLDPSIIYRHQMQVIHDLTHHEMLIDANRLMRDPEFKTAVLEHSGPKVFQEMRAILGDIARGSTIPITPADKFVSWMRQGSVAASIGWNVITGLVHVSGLAGGITRIGAGYVAKGMDQWIRSGPAGQEHTLAWIRGKSEFMDQRAGNVQRDLRDALVRIQAPGVFSDAKASYYSLIGKVVLMTDIPIWLGAYEKAYDTLKQDDFGSAEQLDHHASLLADQAVRDAKGGGLTVDQARVERGSQAQKLFTTFYTYGSARFNQNRELVHRTDFANPKSVGAFMVDALMINVVPIVLIAAMKSALKGQQPSADDLKRETAAAMLDQLIYVRELSSAVMTGEVHMPAGLRVLGATADLAKQAGQGHADAAFWKALNMEGGLLFHYPALQFQRSVEGAQLLFSGRSHNPFALVAGAPTKPH